MWGSVCDDLFGDRDAIVVCRQLGYPTEGARAIGSSVWGQGSGPFWLSQVQCDSSESNLFDCEYTENTDFCGHFVDDVSVVCKTGTCVCLCNMYIHTCIHCTFMCMCMGDYVPCIYSVLYICTYVYSCVSMCSEGLHCMMRRKFHNFIKNQSFYILCVLLCRRYLGLQTELAAVLCPHCRFNRLRGGKLEVSGWGLGGRRPTGDILQRTVG